MWHVAPSYYSFEFGLVTPGFINKTNKLIIFSLSLTLSSPPSFGHLISPRDLFCLFVFLFWLLTDSSTVHCPLTSHNTPFFMSISAWRRLLFYYTILYYFTIKFSSWIFKRAEALCRTRVMTINRPLLNLQWIQLSRNIFDLQTCGILNKWIPENFGEIKSTNWHYYCLPH